MSFDNSRFTFNPWNDYSGRGHAAGPRPARLRLERMAGRARRRMQAGHAGHCSGRPSILPRLRSRSRSRLRRRRRRTVSIGRGRMYVDGLLAENHGDPADARVGPGAGRAVGGRRSRRLPAACTESVAIPSTSTRPAVSIRRRAADRKRAVPRLSRCLAAAGHLARGPDLVEKAVGVDTTGRLQTVWQVKWIGFPEGETYTCATPDSEIAYPSASAGLLTTGHVAAAASGPCCLQRRHAATPGWRTSSTGSRFTRAGAAADPATPSAAGFKWSRDNASVMTGVTEIAGGTNIAGNPAAVLTVHEPRPRPGARVRAGDWIESSDDGANSAGMPGALPDRQRRLSARTITLTTTLPSTPSFPSTPTASRPAGQRTRGSSAGTSRARSTRRTGATVLVRSRRLRRADPGARAGHYAASSRTASLSPSSTAPAGVFNVGDFWTFAARTADGSVEALTAAPPQGIHHHYTKLSIVNFSGPSATDCRRLGRRAEDVRLLLHLHRRDAGGRSLSIQQRSTPCPRRAARSASSRAATSSASC